MKTLGIILIVLAVCMVGIAFLVPNEPMFPVAVGAVFLMFGLLCAGGGSSDLPLPPAAPTILEQTFPRRRVGATRGIYLGLLVAVGVVGGGSYLFLYVWHERDKAETARITAEADKSAEVLAEQILAVAIARGMAIRGMDARQVLQAKGRPIEIHTGPRIIEAAREIGAVEDWVYDRYDGNPRVHVLFDRNGTVIYSGDQVK